jgi:hypothetical protein
MRRAASGIRTPKAIPALAPPESPSLAGAALLEVALAPDRDEVTPKAPGLLSGLLSELVSGVNAAAVVSAGMDIAGSVFDSKEGASVVAALSSLADCERDAKIAPPAITPPANGVSVTKTASPAKV